MPSITTASKRQLDLREFVSESTTEGYTALHFACEGGHDGVVDLLLRHGADREALTLVWSASPLHIAAKHGHLSSVELLLLYGSVIDIRDGKLRTPLHRYSMPILRNCPFKGKGGGAAWMWDLSFCFHFTQPQCPCQRAVVLLPCCSIVSSRRCL